MRTTEKLALAIMALALILITACAGDDHNQPTTMPSPTEAAVAAPTAVIDPTPRNTPVLPRGGPPLQISPDGLDLVFSGGGAKGLAHIGALMELEKRDVPYRRVVGTSSGSIMALMLASGYSAEEMAAAITERTPKGKIIMSQFLDPPTSFGEDEIRDSFLYSLVDTALVSTLPDQIGGPARDHFVEELVKSPVIRELFSLTEYGGVYAGDVFLDFLIEKLDQDGRNLSELSLAEFYEETGSDLTVIVTDTTSHRMLILNHRTAPDLPVPMLIRMSMSVPLVYNNIIWNPEWGSYLGEDINGHEMIDGGIGSNFGIEMVVSQEPQFIEAMGMEPDRERVIGFYLDDTIPVLGAEQSKPAPELDDDPVQEGWDKVTDRNINLFKTVLRSHDQFIVRTHPDVVCHLPAGGFGMLEFDMSEERVALLLNSGQQAMAECLDEMGIE
jgi:predicted acylesterase/phospholipase RssA